MVGVFRNVIFSVSKPFILTVELVFILFYGLSLEIILKKRKENLLESFKIGEPKYTAS